MTAAEQMIDAAADAWAAQMYRDGDLRFLCQEHQLADYDDFEYWNKVRNSDEHIEANRARGATYHHIWVDEIGRRWGKTAKALILAKQEMIRRANARGMIFTPKQKNIGGIIIPLLKHIFRGAPDGYQLEFRGSFEGENHMGVLLPATNSWCKLVGVDVHPDATRGQWLDFCIGTEAAFVKGLAELVDGTISPQFSQRPWAWLLLESSTAKQADHEFNSVYREDAQLRKFGDGKVPYRTHTIDDNTMLTPRDIEIELDRSGGRKSPRVRREYFCEEVRDPEGTVVPEFDAPTKLRPHTAHVVPARSPVPRYACGYVGMDPGFRDPLGALWGYVDFSRNKLVIQADFAELNCSLERAGQVLRERERDLWWTTHREPGRRDQPMVSIADVTKTAGGLVWETPQPALTYWDGEQFVPNPYRRISDVAPQFLGDLHTQHGLSWQATAKDDAEAQLHALRLGFSQNRIEIWDCCEHLIKQLRSGTWNDLRTDWDRTPTLGHLDCVSALIYMWRNIDWRKNPHPPARIETTAYDVALPVGVDQDTATGRKRDSFESRFRSNSGAERKWR